MTVEIIRGVLEWIMPVINFFCRSYYRFYLRLRQNVSLARQMV